MGPRPVRSGFGRVPPFQPNQQLQPRGGALPALSSSGNLGALCLRVVPLLGEVLALTGPRFYSQRSPAQLEQGHVAEALGRSNRCLIMTGAGISAESNIPTLTDMQTNPKFRKLNLHKFAHASGLRHNETPFWKTMSSIWQIADPKPNDGHKAIALFQHTKDPRYGGLVTQNVDGLHQDAGSTGVLETHGTFREGLCTECRTPFPIDIRRFGQPAFREQLPLQCNACGSHTIRPNVVAYGESLDRSITRAVEARFKEADMVLVVGSQARTGAVAQWLRNAHKNNIPIYEININPTELTKKGLSKGIYLGRASTLMPILKKGGLIPEAAQTKGTSTTSVYKEPVRSHTIHVPDGFLKLGENRKPVNKCSAEARTASAATDRRRSLHAATAQVSSLDVKVPQKSLCSRPKDTKDIPATPDPQKSHTTKKHSVVARFKSIKEWFFPRPGSPKAALHTKKKKTA